MFSRRVKLLLGLLLYSICFYIAWPSVIDLQRYRKCLKHQDPDCSISPGACLELPISGELPPIYIRRDWDNLANDSDCSLPIPRYKRGDKVKGGDVFGCSAMCRKDKRCVQFSYSSRVVEYNSDLGGVRVGEVGCHLSSAFRHGNERRPDHEGSIYEGSKDGYLTTYVSGWNVDRIKKDLVLVGMPRNGYKSAETTSLLARQSFDRFSYTSCGLHKIWMSEGSCKAACYLVPQKVF